MVYIKTMKMDRGFVQLYTGDGKGKTTSSLGLAIRAAGWGMKVYIGQFMKGIEYGEVKLIKERLGDLITVEMFGGKEHVQPGNPTPEDVERARHGLERVRLALKGNYDVVIADEISVAVSFGLLKEDDVLELIASKPPEKELILTGRYATKRMIELADLVTEMKEVKHYYQKGVTSRPGIER